MFVERRVTKTTVKINKIVRFQCSAGDSHRDEIERKSKDLWREGQQKSGEGFAWPRRCLGKVLRAEKAIENRIKNYTKKNTYFQGPKTSFLESFGRHLGGRFAPKIKEKATRISASSLKGQLCKKPVREERDSGPGTVSGPPGLYIDIYIYIYLDIFPLNWRRHTHVQQVEFNFTY